MRRTLFPAPVVLVLFLVFPSACLCLVHAEEDPLATLGSGDLLWRSPQGLQPLPALGSNVELTVTGPLVRGRLAALRQRHGGTIEALYAFPPPEEAAVSTASRSRWERRIVGVVKEKEEAKQTRTPRRRGGKDRRAGSAAPIQPLHDLMAHILPGEMVEVHLAWLQEVRAEDGRFQVVVPDLHPALLGAAASRG